MGESRKRKNKIKEKKKLGEVEERKKEKRVVGKDGEKGGRSERKRTETIGG